MSDDDVAQLIGNGIGLAIAGVFCVVGLIIQAFVCVFLSKCYKQIPQEFRKMEPNMVWLLFVPCLNIIWNFFVYPQLSQSNKAYFNSIGDETVGDCGQGLGIAYSVLAVISCIPYLGACFGLPALVVLILYLLKASELRKKIAEKCQ